MPGRTDNEIKNFWNTRIKGRLRDGLPLYPQSQKPRQASSSQSPPPSQSAVVQNQLLVPQYRTTIPLFHSPFESCFHGTAHVYDQNSSSTLLQRTSPLSVPPPRHKRCRDSAAFSISIPSASSNDHPWVSPHGILPNTPLRFNLSSTRIEMGAMLSPNLYFVVNPELPSSQSQCSRLMKTAESCSGRFLYSDPGVLRDVMEEAHAMANAPHTNFSNAYSKCPQVNRGRSLNVGPLGYALGGLQDDFGHNLGLDPHGIAGLLPGKSMVALRIFPWENLPEIY